MWSSLALVVFVVALHGRAEAKACEELACVPGVLCKHEVCVAQDVEGTCGDVIQVACGLWVAACAHQQQQLPHRWALLPGRGRREGSGQERLGQRHSG